MCSLRCTSGASLRVGSSPSRGAPGVRARVRMRDDVLLVVISERDDVLSRHVVVRLIIRTLFDQLRANVVPSFVCYQLRAKVVPSFVSNAFSFICTTFSI